MEPCPNCHVLIVMRVTSGVRSAMHASHLSGRGPTDATDVEVAPSPVC